MSDFKSKKIFVLAIMAAMFFVACEDGGYFIRVDADKFLDEKEKVKMFKFLKVGNVFTYQDDYAVECGTGYVGNIFKISIDSVINTDSETMYYGTSTFYSRKMDDWETGKLDTFDVHTANNVLLFTVKNAVVTFSFTTSLKIPYNAAIGTVVDSVLNFDNELVYCKFEKIGNYSVFKQTDGWDEDYSNHYEITYKNCLIASSFFYKYWAPYMSSTIWRSYVYNSNYGLIEISKGTSSPIGPDGWSLSLIETNF